MSTEHVIAGSNLENNDQTWLCHGSSFNSDHSDDDVEDGLFCNHVYKNNRLMMDDDCEAGPISVSNRVVVMIYFGQSWSWGKLMFVCSQNFPWGQLSSSVPSYPLLPFLCFFSSVLSCPSASIPAFVTIWLTMLPFTVWRTHLYKYRHAPMYRKIARKTSLFLWFGPYNWSSNSS